METLNPDIPKMGYVMCVKAPEKKDIFARGIIAEQKKHGLSDKACEYVHVEVLGGGYYSVRVAPPTTQIVEDFSKFYKGRYVTILRYNDEAYEQRLRYKIAFWAASHCNLGYDWFGIAHFLLGKLVTGSKTKQFCSENTLWAIRKEIPFAMKNIDQIHDCMPAHFIDSSEFETVWEGTL